MTEDAEPRARSGPRPAPKGVRPGGRRGHAALGGRIVAAGIGSAATLGLAALMAAADPGWSAEPAAVTVPPSVATTAPAPAEPRQTIVRVIVRRSGPPTPGSAATATSPAVSPAAAGPAVVAPAPAPVPAPAPAAPPVVRTRAS